MSPTSFFDKNIGVISGKVMRLNHLCRDLESNLDFSKPDYVNVELIKEEAFKRGIQLPTARAFKLLSRIKRKHAGWKTGGVKRCRPISQCEPLQLPPSRLDVGFHSLVVDYWPNTSYKPRRVRCGTNDAHYARVCLCGKFFKTWGPWADHAMSCEKYQEYKATQG